MNPPPNDKDQSHALDAALHGARRRRARRLMIAFAAGLAVLTAALAFAGLSRGVRLLITPADAAARPTVALRDGIGLTLGDRVYTFSSRLRARVEAPGFFAEEVALTPAPGSNYVEVELRERPAQLQLRTQPPSDLTRWRLDEHILGDGESLAASVPPGTYTLRADSPFHRPIAQAITLARAEERSLAIPLTPIEGQLSIASQPAGAEVLINGELRGRSPLTVTVEGGEYRVEVRHERYAEVIEQARITRQHPTITRNYRLLANPAHLQVSVSPAGGTLTIDGSRRATDSAPFRLAPDLPHAVVYAAPGYATQAQTLTLGAGERHQLALHLSAQFGEVRVESEPAAEVFVNGEGQGRTPLSLTLATVDQHIELRKPGYATLARTLRPSPSAPQLLSATLLTLEQGASAAAPPRYRSADGLQFLRFDPTGSFLLGAAPDEPGQRANEPLREVRLTRAFYISRTEVTRAQYARSRGTAGSGNGDHPITDVSWADAARYCNWLSAREELTPVYHFAGSRYLGADLSATGYRLPTEAEWEWLARGAGRRQAARFPWGSEYEVPERAGNFADETAAKDSTVRADLTFYLPRYTDGFARLAPVGSFPPHRSGLQDLAGNVREWTHDVYEIVPPSAEAGRDPAGPTHAAGQQGHVVKGSGWRDGRVENLRAAHRSAGDGAADDLGFRVARYIY